MPMTNAERQAAYRESRLLNGSDSRLNVILSATAKAGLDRLASHRGATIRATLEALIGEAENRATGRMSVARQREYYG